MKTRGVGEFFPQQRLILQHGEIIGVRNTDIGQINGDSTSYNGDAEIKSPMETADEILNPFDDGKKAAAYALLI
ncbi:MAG: hypothetical protein ABI876_16760, partial [Bacteroidota bacterium]